MIKQIYIRILFVILIVNQLSFTGFSQDLNPIKKSTNKVMIDGIKYFVHIVEEGQTLFSICKTYEVSQETLIEKNPFLSTGLKTGQVLKIPIIEEDKQVSDEKQSDKFFFHIVKENETLYSISKKYNVPIEEIIKSNSEIETTSIQMNQELKIPKNKIDEKAVSKETETDNDGNIYHIVKKKETLYSLSRIYNISIDEITAINPDVSSGLKEGQKIKITYKKPQIVVAPIDTVPIIVAIDCDTIKKRDQQNPINIAFLLPFFLYENDNPIDTGKKRVNKEEYIYSKSENSIEFYQGALLAIEELKKKGISINVYTYDVGKDSIDVTRVLLKEEFKTMNIIIGPAYSSNFHIASRFAKENKIVIVSPLSSKSSGIDDNPYAFQVNPSLETEIDNACKYISTICDKNMLFIYSRHIPDYDIVQCFKTMLAKYPVCEGKSTIRKIVFDDDTVRPKLEDILSDKIENFIIIPSEREAMAGEVIAKLIPLHNLGYKVNIIGLPSWPKFPNIDVEYFYNLEMVSYTPFYFDFNDPKIVDFIKKYRMFYASDIYKVSSEGYNSSLLGYDISLYFLSAFSRFGSNLINCISNYSTQTLQTKFNFQHITPEGGFENKQITFLKFLNDISITRVNVLQE